MFAAPKLTDAGKTLYYENMGGTGIKFTKIQMGKGTLSGSIAALTSLVDPVVTMDAEVTNNQGQYCDVSGKFSNADLAEGFYWREIGVFAEDPDYPDDRSRDILYCYQNAYDTADFIPVASVQTVEKNITVPMIVGDASTVSCTLSRSMTMASTQDLENHNENQNAHGSTFVKATDKGKAGGVATLGDDGVLVKEQRPKADNLYMPDGNTKISDEINKKSSDLQNHNESQNAHGSTFVKATDKGKAGGVATLGDDGVLIKEQRPKADNLYMPDGSTKISDEMNKKSYKPIFKSVTLSASAWGSAKTQTITVQGVLADEKKQFIVPTPALASQTAYYEAGILITAQAANSLTFTAKYVPETDLTVYVVIQEVTQG